MDIGFTDHLNGPLADVYPHDIINGQMTQIPVIEELDVCNQNPVS